MKKKIILIMMIFSMCFNSTNIFAAANASNLKRESSTTKSKNVINLVGLSTTVVYSQVKNISSKYNNYLGKTIKYDGTMKVINAGDNNYYMAMANDVKACCTAGLEFIVKGGSVDEEKYPKDGAKIRVSGKLEEYKEGNNKYVHLVDTEVEVLDK